MVPDGDSELKVGRLILQGRQRRAEIAQQEGSSEVVDLSARAVATQMFDALNKRIGLDPEVLKIGKKDPARDVLNAEGAYVGIVEESEIRKSPQGKYKMVHLVLKKGDTTAAFKVTSSLDEKPYDRVTVFVGKGENWAKQDSVIVDEHKLREAALDSSDKIVSPEKARQILETALSTIPVGGTIANG